MPPIHWDTIITGLISAAILAGIRMLTKALKDYSAESKAWRSSLDVKLDTLTAGRSLTFGRYQQQGAVYQNGTNYSWVTIRVVG